VIIMLPIQLRELLNDLEAAPVECDGMCRLITTRLQNLGIAHQVMVGSVSLNDGSIPHHYWIVVGDLTVDYRARMWLGESPLVPHGIFRQDTCAARYDGIEIQMDALHPSMVQLLSMPFSEPGIKAQQSPTGDEKVICLGDMVDRNQPSV
jgi:hypothetical protein